MITVLKMNYEKVTLFFSLGMTVCCLYYLLLFIMDSIPDVPPFKLERDYQAINPELYPGKPLPASKWLVTTGYKNREKNNSRSDLTRAMEAARCPHCTHLIPVVDFENKKCSYCNKRLALPEQVKYEFDSDNDGIPDHVEEQFKLNPKDPSDADYDLDQDGFSNYFEYKTSKTELDNAKSRPALVSHVRLERIIRKKLPIRFSRVTTHQAKDKSSWFVFGQIGKRGKVHIWQLGDVLRVKNKQYKIIDIHFKQKKGYNPKLRTIDDIDESKIILKRYPGRNDDLPIVATVNKDVFTQNKYVTLNDLLLKQLFIQRIKGDCLTLGNQRVGTEIYVISTVDCRNKKVKLQRVNSNGDLTQVYEIALKRKN